MILVSIETLLQKNHQPPQERNILGFGGPRKMQVLLPALDSQGVWGGGGTQLFFHIG